MSEEKTCIDCKYCYSNDSLDGLYICVNGDSDLVGEWTGICAPACEAFVSDYLTIEEKYDF